MVNLREQLKMRLQLVSLSCVTSLYDLPAIYVLTVYRDTVFASSLKQVIILVMYIVMHAANPPFPVRGIHLQ